MYRGSPMYPHILPFKTLRRKSQSSPRLSPVSNMMQPIALLLRMAVLSANGEWCEPSRKYSKELVERRRSLRASSKTLLRFPSWSARKCAVKQHVRFWCSRIKRSWDSSLAGRYRSSESRYRSTESMNAMYSPRASLSPRFLAYETPLLGSLNNLILESSPCRRSTIFEE